MNLEIWHIWIIIAMGFFIAEIFTPGFLLACFGIACLTTGLFSFFELGAKAQIITFSISTLVVFFGIRPFVLKYFYTSTGKLKTNIDALIGKTGLVSERIDPNINKGRVIIGGEDWRGISIDENIIETGEKIKVVRVDGTKLYIKPVAKGQED
jgi:membrane protein implicated in regulation of membrane protease activity